MNVSEEQRRVGCAITDRLGHGRIGLRAWCDERTWHPEPPGSLGDQNCARRAAA